MDKNSLLLILITMGIVSLIDYIPRLVLLSKRQKEVVTGYTRVPRYFILPTVYGDIAYLQNLQFLKRYHNRVVVCTSRYESPEFYTALRKVCRTHKLRYICVDVPLVNGIPNKNAYTIYKGVFSNLHRIGATADTPCLLIDADTYAPKNVNNLVRAFGTHQLDIASLRCEAARPQKLIEVLQAYEYRLAMDNRRMDPWLTSGACNIAKAGVYREVFSRHSNFFAGGDIEIGKLAQVMGYKIAHLNFTFYTAVPDTFKDWFNQRIVWFAGGVRHHVANIGSFGWHHFFIFFYNSLIVYLLFPLRWIEVTNFPLTLAALVVLSWFYTAILTVGKGWKVSYLVLPVYAFLQSMIILPLAVIRYGKYAWRQKSLGILNYNLSRYSVSTRIVFRTLNVSTAMLVIVTAMLFTKSRIDYWYTHGTLLQDMLRLPLG